MAIRRALTLKNVAGMKIPRFSFTGEWFNAFGTPQSCGVWFVYGESGSGKTTFVFNLIKCLAQHSNSVLLESYEEGEASVSLQENINSLGLADVKNVYIIDESKDEMIERLSMRRSPNVILIDSIEHSEFKDIKQVVDLKNKFPKKLFVFIGQASGVKPRTLLGESILFIANQKIRVEGYRAFCRGRSFGPIGYFTIWKEEAIKYWGK